MRVLLDSQAVFWVMTGDLKLGVNAAAILADTANRCLSSPVSHWEMAMKISVGKYEIDGDFEQMWLVALARFPTLGIEPRHMAR